MKRWGILAAALASAAPVWAGEKVLYQPTPDWVTPAPAIDASKQGDDAPVIILLDTQQRLQDGQVWAYIESATRIPSAQALGQIGTVQLPWQPAQGDLIIHSGEIVRGNQRIDLIAGKDPFTVIRREERLAQRELDGMLTATYAIPGLQVGDVVHFRLSITRKDPTLKGEVQSAAPLVLAPNRVGFARTRLLWPTSSDVKWKVYAKGAEAQPVTNGAWRELVVIQPLPKPADVPSDAPLRYQPFPVVEASSFADWTAVSKVMAPLYATDGLIAPGSPLAGEVARIMKAESDPLKRAALALQLVQDKVSYLLLGMETGNYVPQSPADTWAARYGDCKAKTLLLLALLHAMEIEAEPVLASVKANAMLSDRLPSAGAFDHVLVRATIGGEDVWLDGTDGGARLVDLRDTPNLGRVLPVRATGAALMPIAMRPAARPMVTIETAFDQSAGVRLPAPYTMTLTVRGAVAEQFRAGAAAGSREQVDGIVDKLTQDHVGQGTDIATRALTYDAATGLATVRSTGVAYPEWQNENGRLRYGLDKSVGEMEFKPDRARAAWRDIPVRTGDPETFVRITRVRLPRGLADGFAVEGPSDYAETLAGRRVERAVTRTGDELTVRETAIESGAEIAVADIAATRQKVAAAKAKRPTLVAPADYPAGWQEVAQAGTAGRIAPLLAIYAARIRAKPDEAVMYADRAWFLNRIYDRKAALADYDRAIAIEPTVSRLTERSLVHARLGQSAKSLADAEAAYALDPSATGAIYRLAYVQAMGGQADKALAMVQDRIDADDDDKHSWLSEKATLQSLAGDADGALATMDDAIALKPREGNLYNNRCWIAGTRDTGLERALKDCNRAIELEGDAAGYLDSRAMVHFRAGRLAEAKTDLDAALTRAPNEAGSLFLRAVVARRLSQSGGIDTDLKAARLIDPEVDTDYKRWGIVP